MSFATVSARKQTRTSSRRKSIVVRSLDVFWLAARFTKFSALNTGKLGVLKATHPLPTSSCERRLAKKLAGLEMFVSASASHRKSAGIVIVFR
jgi:hypothetical protein